MKKLEELEKKYAELGRKIEALKSDYPIYCLSKHSGIIIKFTGLQAGLVFKQNKTCNVGFVDYDWTSHTNTDVWQQLDVCSETGFYDGQLVWCWDKYGTHERRLRFYDAKNETTFDAYSKRNGCWWHNYEPFEGNWPEWALEAFKTLER